MELHQTSSNEVLQQEQFETLQRELKTLFDANPTLRSAFIQLLSGTIALSSSVNTPIKDQGVVTSARADEANVSRRTMEDELSEMYQSDNYEIMAARPMGERPGVAGVGVSNESFFRENLVPPRTPDGYLIGTGNGAIWSMLELFPEGRDPKGIISIDMDPSVVLSGKVLVELAKRGIPKEEAIAYLYGGRIPNSKKTNEYYSHEVEDVIAIARGIAFKEENPSFRQALQFALEKEKDGFIKDVNFMRDRHWDGYKKPLFEQGIGPLEIKGRINTSAVIYKHWDQIVRLANEGKIFFAYSDIRNEKTLDFIARKVPEIERSTNLIYTSNVGDGYRYGGSDENGGRNLDMLTRFNPLSKSFFVFTTQRQDQYALKISNSPSFRT